MKSLVLGILALLFSGVVVAEGSVFDDPSLRIVGGFGTTKVGGVMDTSYTVFVGIDSYARGNVRSGFEVGGVDVNRSNADAFLATGVFSYDIAPDAHLFGRLGIATGAVAGPALGAGLGYFIERNMEVRVELLKLVRSDGVQFNLAYYPNQNAYW